jgi:hypothetical protein
MKVNQIQQGATQALSKGALSLFKGLPTSTPYGPRVELACMNKQGEIEEGLTIGGVFKLYAPLLYFTVVRSFARFAPDSHTSRFTVMKCGWYLIGR